MHGGPRFRRMRIRPRQICAPCIRVRVRAGWERVGGGAGSDEHSYGHCFVGIAVTKGRASRLFTGR